MLCRYVWHIDAAVAVSARSAESHPEGGAVQLADASLLPHDDARSSPLQMMLLACASHVERGAVPHFDAQSQRAPCQFWHAGEPRPGGPLDPGSLPFPESAEHAPIDNEHAPLSSAFTHHIFCI